MLCNWTPMKAFLPAIGGIMLVSYLGLVEITC